MRKKAVLVFALLLLLCVQGNAQKKIKQPKKNVAPAFVAPGDGGGGGGGGCTSRPDAPNVSVMQPDCGSTTGTVTVNSPVGSNIEYIITTVETVISTTIQTTTFPLDAGQSYTIASRYKNTGCSSSNTTSVTISLAPSSTWYKDTDNDGYSDGTTLTQCAQPTGYKLATALTATSGDCDENNPKINPATLWFLDADEDGYSDNLYIPAPGGSCTPPQDGRNYILNPKGSDCDDNDATYNPETVWVKDADGDGYYTGEPYTGCFFFIPEGYVRKTTQQPGDCDDANPAISPATAWYKDADNDGYSDGTSIIQCSQPTGYKLATALTATAGDCDDNDASLNAAIVWYRDADGDGYAISITSCTNPGEGYTKNELPLGDCNDANAAINPETIWYEDRDNDGYPGGRTATGCERPRFWYNVFSSTPGKLASELISTTLDCDDASSSQYPVVWYKDVDNDRFGDGTSELACYRPPGYKRAYELASVNGDCDDADAAINPETRWYPDLDNDGYSTGNYWVQCPRPTGFKLSRELTSITGDCNDNDATLRPNTIWLKDADNDGYTDGVQKTQCLRPTGYKLPAELTGLATDCNDDNAALNPATVWYQDADNDGYSNGTTKNQCSQPTGYKLASQLTATTGDCDDNDASLNAAIVWYRDADGDGYAISTTSCTNPGEGYTKNELPLGDCNDANAAINPETIWYEDRDNDGYPGGRTATGCERPRFWYNVFSSTPGKLASELISTTLDCDDASSSQYPVVWYKDVDNDRFGDGTSELACYRPPGYKRAYELASVNGDCDDADAAINPETRWYPDLDNDGYSTGNYWVQCPRPTGFKLSRELTSITGDCNDNDATLRPNTIWLKDADNDGYTDGVQKTQCIRPTGYKLATALTATSGDCDDNNATLNQNTTWYKDEDGDGYSDGTSLIQCSQPTGYKLATALTATSGDCDDNNATLNPATIWIRDADGDGYYLGNPATGCTSPGTGYILLTTQLPGDCSDNNAAVNPGAAEVCGNGVDDNCNGLKDEKACYACQNASGFSTTDITTSSAILEWSTTPANLNPQDWELRYKTIKPGSKWITVEKILGNKREYNLAGLAANQKYTWQIRAKCGKNYTDFSAAVEFKTGGKDMAARSATEKSRQSNSVDIPEGLVLYPNPGSDQVTVQMKLPGGVSGTALIHLLDLSGKQVMTQTGVLVNGILQKQIVLPASLHSGLYVVRIIANGKQYSAKLMISK